MVFLWSPLVIISPRDKSVEFPKPPCWLTQFQVQLPEACLPLALLHHSSPAPRARVSPQLHAGSALGRLLLSPAASSAGGALPAAASPSQTPAGHFTRTASYVRSITPQQAAPLSRLHPLQAPLSQPRPALNSAPRREPCRPAPACK